MQQQQNPQQPQRGQGRQQVGQYVNRRMGGVQGPGASTGPPGTQQTPHQAPPPHKRSRWFVALFDYDPATMSPNPDACDEELPFSEGDTIKVF